MDIEVSIYGNGHDERTTAVSASDAGLGTINLIARDGQGGDPAADMVGFFAFPASSWPSLRAAVDEALGS